MSSHNTALRTLPPRAARSKSRYGTRRTDTPLPKKSRPSRKNTRTGAKTAATTSATIAAEELTPPHLPDELISEIISIRIGDRRGGRDALMKDLGSLCLTFKSFVETCQREMFRIVIIQPRRCVNQEELSRVSCQHDSTRRFLEVVTKNPQLGSYVRRLVYRWMPGELDISAALDTMSGVGHLTIEVPEGGNQTRSLVVSDGRLGRSLCRLMTNAGLKSLTTRNLDLELKDFELPVGLKKLVLWNSWFKIPWVWNLPPHETAQDQPISALKRLIIRGEDAVSETSWIATVQQERGYPGLALPLNFQNVEFLEVAVGEVLRLRQLHLSVGDLIRNSDISSEFSPLHGINPACFNTLTRLSHQICLHIPTRRPISDPYGGLFLDPALLLKLTKLEELAIRVRFTADEWGSTVPEAFGPQWNDLDATIAPPTGCPFPHMKRVSTLVFLEESQDLDGIASFKASFKNLVLDRQFRGLERLQEEGIIDFMVGVELGNTSEDF